MGLTFDLVFVTNFRCQVSGVRFQVSGFRCQGSAGRKKTEDRRQMAEDRRQLRIANCELGIGHRVKRQRSEVRDQRSAGRSGGFRLGGVHPTPNSVGSIPLKRDFA